MNLNLDKDLEYLFEQALKDDSYKSNYEGGIITKIIDGMIRIEGIKNPLYYEEVIFQDTVSGIILDIDEYGCLAFVLSGFADLKEGFFVKRTRHIFKIPVSSDILGSVCDPLMNVLNSTKVLQKDNLISVERNIPGIEERESINQSFLTGIFTIDALIPIGKGQRQLLIGNRSTGKTSMALKAMINQKNNNMICIYVSIGKKNADTSFLVDFLRKNNALDYSIIIAANASSCAALQYMAPYVGISIAEYFSDQKKDVYIIYDDLSNHAVAYREMSLLMKRSPSREAYPGDIFYTHARLLERAGNFINKGSITALPIVEIQENDLSAYIPTNLISITDGQIFFDSTLFNANIKPAINTELSVSRVGSAAQSALTNFLVRGIRLEIAQYHELQAFSQFTSELDEQSEKMLKKGKIIVELFKQEIDQIYNYQDSIILLLLIRYHSDLLIKGSLPLLLKSIAFLLDFIKIHHNEEYDLIKYLKKEDKENIATLNITLSSVLEKYLN